MAMTFRSTLKFGTIVLLGLFASRAGHADYEIDRLMNSYIVAKAEVAQTPSTEDEAKAHPYTVQVASYINEKDAVSHLEELKPQVKGQKLRYFPTFVHGQVWYKVCVGEFVTKEEAETYKKDFVKKTDEPFAVVISLLDRPKSDKDAPDSNADKDAVSAKKRKPASSNGGGGDADKDTPFGTAEGGDSKALQPVPAFSGTEGGTKQLKVAAADPKTAPKADAVTAPSAKPAAMAKKDAKDGNFFSLQVGSYPSEALAKENIAKMDKKQDAFVQAATVNGKQWYRVYIGKFKSKREAEDFQKTMAGQESFVRHVTK